MVSMRNINYSSVIEMVQMRGHNIWFQWEEKLSLSHWDGSDEESQHMVSMRNRKNYPSVITEYSLISRSLIKVFIPGYTLSNFKKDCPSYKPSFCCCCWWCCVYVQGKQQWSCSDSQLPLPITLFLGRLRPRKWFKPVPVIIIKCPYLPVPCSKWPRSEGEAGNSEPGYLTLKAPNKIAADNSLSFSFIFRRK